MSHLTIHKYREPNYLRAYKAPLLPSPFSLLPFPFLPAYKKGTIFTTVESALQIRPFMQNKPNFLDAQMNVNKVLTKDYENISDWTLGENKPNQTQFPKSTNECKLTYNKGLQKIG